MFGAVRVSPTLVHFELAAGIGFGGTGLAVDFGVAVEFGVTGTAPSFNTPRHVYDFPFIWTTCPTDVHTCPSFPAAPALGTRTKVARRKVAQSTDRSFLTTFTTPLLELFTRRF
jgi:hypothetical protein